MAGYIKIHRNLLNWGWYSVPCVKDVFIHFLITANYSPSEYQGVSIDRGQAVFGYSALSQALGYSVKQIRTAIDKLKKTGEITVWTNRQFSVATITNYDKYQDMNEIDARANEGQTKGKRRANEGQTDGTQRATSKEIKKEIKKYIHTSLTNSTPFAKVCQKQKPLPLPERGGLIKLRLS